MADAGVLFAVGAALILAGVLVVAIAVLVFSIRSAKGGKVRAGGAVIIGPVPIIFGTDKKSLKTVLLLSLALTILLVVVMVVYYLLLR